LTTLGICNQSTFISALLLHLLALYFVRHLYWKVQQNQSQPHFLINKLFQYICGGVKMEAETKPGDTDS
jgi:hypothetical protein